MANKPADFTPSLDGYSGQRPFRFWCQKVLPLVYDDSLSYYELLNKVVHYLNNAISDVATVEENVQGLHDAYVKLQEYVNNYFSTLDVQEEIDNKLDTMAQDGSLSALISPLLPAIIAQWMEDNITPTTPVVDKSLSIEGAAADAQVVGVNMIYPKPYLPYVVDGVIDLNNIVEQGHYILDVNYTLTNAPEGFTPTGLIVERFRDVDRVGFVRQTAIEIAGVSNRIYTRHSNAFGEWGEWFKFDTTINVLDEVHTTAMYPKSAHNYAIDNTIDLNNIIEQGHYVLDTKYTLTNAPEGFRPTGLIVERFRSGDSDSFVRQTAIAIGDLGDDKQYVRHSNVNGVWTDWCKYLDSSYIAYPKPASPYAIEGVIDLNNIVEQGHYILDVNYTLTNAPEGFTPTGLIVERFRDVDRVGFVRQTAIEIAGVSNRIYTRHSNAFGEWGEWFKFDTTINVLDEVHTTAMYPKSAHNYAIDNTIDLNNIIEQGHYVLDTKYTLTNAPEGFRPTGLIVERFRSGDSDSFVRQTAIAIASSKYDKQYVRHSNVSGVWTNWTPLGESVTNVVNKNVTENTYNNTYNINTNPHFTTDENGWLNAVDDETTIESSATDMTGAILSLLNDTGYCHLGPGTFYVSGGIELPSGAMIEGCGNNTIVRLLSDRDNYIFRPVRYSIIKNIRLSGGKEFTPVADIGGRNGIYFYDNKTDFNDSGSVDTQPCIIDSVYFDHFSGAGIYGHGTGGGTAEILMVSNCVMEQCTCGINLEFFTEYCKFVSIVTRSCYYGCINNGGNNVFVGCTFHGTTGFVIDNTADDKINIAHGSCNGCTFNHIGGNTGYSIKIDNCNTTFLFDGCNWWYGTIHIDSSSGIIFNGLEGGGSTNTIEVSNSSNILFSNMMLNVTPTLSIVSSNNVRFKDVLNYKTGEYIGE